MVERYLDEVEKDMVAHAEEFRTLAEGKPWLPFLPAPGGFLDRYRVNVLVDRSQAHGAPVVLETNPTYSNLFGRVEHRVHFGSLVTDFTLIKAGALHRANGGYLILEAVDVLRIPLAWDALKKALKNRLVRIEDPLEEWRMASATGLAPEPIPLSVRAALRGDRGRQRFVRRAVRALLSSLTGIPLDQGLAVTGSVNQLGQIQPVGGINEKVEGLFDVCRARGLTGRQGVLIPESNARHLMLREDVVQAVREEQFHVHAIATVDEGLALLTGRAAGLRGPDGRFPEGSFNAAVEQALEANVTRLRALRADPRPAS